MLPRPPTQIEIGQRDLDHCFLAFEKYLAAQTEESLSGDGKPQEQPNQPNRGPQKP